MSKKVLNLITVLILAFGFVSITSNQYIYAETKTNEQGKLVDENGKVVEKTPRSGVTPVNEDTKDKQATEEQNKAQDPFFGTGSMVILFFIVASGLYYLYTSRTNKKKGVLQSMVHPKQKLSEKEKKKRETWPF